jgi:hypothetical protein
LPRECQSEVVIGLKSLVKSSYHRSEMARMIDKPLPQSLQLTLGQATWLEASGAR